MSFQEPGRLDTNNGDLARDRRELLVGLRDFDKNVDRAAGIVKKTEWILGMHISDETRRELLRHLAVLRAATRARNERVPIREQDPGREQEPGRLDTNNGDLARDRRELLVGLRDFDKNVDRAAGIVKKTGWILGMHISDEIRREVIRRLAVLRGAIRARNKRVPIREEA